MEETAFERAKIAMKNLTVLLETPEGKASIKKFRDKLLAEQKFSEDFFESMDFNNIYQNVIDEVEVDDEDRLYHFFDSLKLAHQNCNPDVQEVMPDPAPYFSTTTFKYKNVLVEVINGQGTIVNAMRADSIKYNIISDKP